MSLVEHHQAQDPLRSYQCPGEDSQSRNFGKEVGSKEKMGRDPGGRRS